MSPKELKGKKEKFVSPNQILKNPKLSPFIMYKINNADTKYPILVLDCNMNVTDDFMKFYRIKLIFCYDHVTIIYY